MEASNLEGLDRTIEVLEKTTSINFQELLAIIAKVTEASVAVLKGNLIREMEKFFLNSEIETLHQRVTEEAIKLRDGTNRDVYSQIQLTSDELAVVKKAVFAIAVIIFVENYKRKLMTLN